VIRYAANVVTGGVFTAGAFAASHLQLFAQSVLGNVTPLMIMAVLTWLARVIHGARFNYRQLCDKVIELEEAVTRIESALLPTSKKGKRRG